MIDDCENCDCGILVQKYVMAVIWAARGVCAEVVVDEVVKIERDRKRRRKERV